MEHERQQQRATEREIRVEAVLSVVLPKSSMCSKGAPPSAGSDAGTPKIAASREAAARVAAMYANKSKAAANIVGALWRAN